ncbi:MAG: hypothetical protein HY815_01345, partial [Candidatus Riflebacteria bacterium]|nr:hypothetical protein [Candidatus Riflebacteria bacterium]
MVLNKDKVRQSIFDVIPRAAKEAKAREEERRKASLAMGQPVAPPPERQPAPREAEGPVIAPPPLAPVREAQQIPASPAPVPRDEPVPSGSPIVSEPVAARDESRSGGPDGATPAAVPAARETVPVGRAVVDATPPVVARPPEPLAPPTRPEARDAAFAPPAVPAQADGVQNLVSPPDLAPRTAPATVFDPGPPAPAATRVAEPARPESVQAPASTLLSDLEAPARSLPAASQVSPAERTSVIEGSFLEAEPARTAYCETPVGFVQVVRRYLTSDFFAHFIRLFI